MKFVSMKCPECNANISIEENRRFCFCQYCGTKILVDDGSTTHTYRKVDEARIKEAEVERQIRFREIDFEEKLRESKEKRTLLKIKLSIALGIIGAIFMMIGFVGGELTGNPDSSIYMFSFLGLFSIMAVAFIWLGDTSDKNK